MTECGIADCCREADPDWVSNFFNGEEQVGVVWCRTCWDNVLSLKQSTWIPVSERLPEDKVDVLLFKYYDVYAVGSKRGDEIWLVDGEDGYPINYWHYWTPLPADPASNAQANKDEE